MRCASAMRGRSVSHAQLANPSGVILPATRPRLDGTLSAPAQAAAQAAMRARRAPAPPAARALSGPARARRSPAAARRSCAPAPAAMRFSCDRQAGTGCPAGGTKSVGADTDIRLHVAIPASPLSTSLFHPLDAASAGPSSPVLINHLPARRSCYTATAPSMQAQPPCRPPPVTP